MTFPYFSLQLYVATFKNIFVVLWCCFLVLAHLACTPREVSTVSTAGKAYRATKYITYNNVGVDVVIDKPANDTVDVLVAYHGTVFVDSRILEAAGTTLDRVKAITMRQDMMIVSVAYPEEGLLFGDNIRESEAALLWVKQKASAELGVVVKKVFLVGHSQGGYIVTRLNTMHTSDGVVANAPGPLNLALRCQMEEANQLPGSPVCALLRNTYGSARTNPQPYNERSLLNFTNNFKADILFTQGLQDAQIQLISWSTFQQQVNQCTTCRQRIFLDIPEYGHNALFESPTAIQAYNAFLRR